MVGVDSAADVVDVVVFVVVVTAANNVSTSLIPYYKYFHIAKAMRITFYRRFLLLYIFLSNTLLRRRSADSNFCHTTCM